MLCVQQRKQLTEYQVSIGLPTWAAKAGNEAVGRKTTTRQRCHRFISLIAGIFSRFKQDIVLQCLPAVSQNNVGDVLSVLFSETLEQVLTQIPWSLVFGPAPPRKRGPVLFLRWYWRISGESPLADSQPTVDRLSADGRLTACRPTVGRQSSDRSTDCRPTVHRRSIDCR